jgi:hypothetical protein
MLELRRVDLGSDHDVTTTPMVKQRGYVAVPTPDMREYVRSQAVTLGVGFVMGMTIGALFGNLLERRNR